MADSAPPEPHTQKFSRYRSVRRAQAQQTQSPLDTPDMPAMPQMPPMPVDSIEAAPVSRSMSRYHRRPAASNKTSPLRANTVDLQRRNGPVPVPVPTQDPMPPRNRALSSPHARAGPSAPPRVPNTSRARAEAVPMPTANSRPRTARDEAKQLMQDEPDRHRRMRDKIEAEKRAKLKADQAERDRQDQQRREAEELDRLRAQEEAEAAEELRRQREEKERGKRLQKAESAKRQQEREEAERRARIDEPSRRNQPPSSPPTSPPRQPGRFGLFSRRRDNSEASQSPPSTARPPLPSHDSSRDMDTIRPGGGGAVLGIDAPISAVNAGDRVCSCPLLSIPVPC